MRRNSFFKIGGLAAVLAFAACVIRLQGQQSKNNSSSPSITTNWIGSLVVGKNDTVDRIAPGPYPKSVPQVEIGLRSDGVVVWRNTPPQK